MASQTLNFPCASDSYTAVHFPTSNFGNSTTLRVGRSYLSSPLSTFASFLGFNLSTIPKNKVIKSAYITVHVISFTSHNGIPMPADYYTYEGALANAPMVIRARRVSDVPLADINSLLTFDYVKALPGNGNVYDIVSAGNDTSCNVSLARGTTINIPIYDLGRTSDNEFVVALFRDDNFDNGNQGSLNTSIYSKEGYYVPQLTLVIDDYVPPKPSNLTPSNTTRNKAGEINLSWQWEDTYMGTSQTSYEVAYSTNGFATSTSKTGTTSASYTAPADTFTLGQTVQWKVRITDTNGDTSAWSDTMSFTIGATLPSTPEVLSPINTIVNSSDEIYYRWKFIDAYGYQQAKFDLQYRKGVAAETTIAVTSPTNQYIMPISTIVDGGDYSWRVRCYNAFGEVSSYSAWQPFYAIGKPQAPIITSVSNNSKPLIKWTASNQDIFILKLYKNNIVIYDSGEQVGNTEYTIDEFIADGAYKVGIIISNVYGFWSNETQLPFTITTVKPDKPSISSSSNNLRVALIINSTATSNLVYRKGEKEDSFKLLGVASENIFIDYSVPAGGNQYFVRAISSTSFIDSDIITINMRFDGIVLSGKNNPSDMINLYKTKDTDKRKSISPSKAQFTVQFNGRTYPTLQTTPFKNHSENHEYFVDASDFDTLYRIANYNTLIYRNNYGYGFDVQISNLLIQEDVFGYIASFILTRLEGENE